MLFGLLLSIACMYSANAQIPSCPPITINDLGSTTELSINGLIARAIFPPGEGSGRIPVRIRDFKIVCDTSGTRINTSSYVSVVVELQCDSQSSNPTLDECDGSTLDTRQYQFQCIEENEQSVWGNIVDGNNQFVQTLNPDATLSTPLANQCRRCIDNLQSMRVGLDPITHCDRELANSVHDHTMHGRPFLDVIFIQPQHVHHNVTRDKGVAILGQMAMSAVTSTCKGTV